MKKLISFLIILVLLIFLAIIFIKFLHPVKVMTPSEKVRSIVLNKVASDINSALTSADEDFALATNEIARHGIMSDTTRAIMQNLHKRHQFIVDCSIVDTNGIMIIVEPEQYKSHEGSDIHDQEQIQTIHQKHQPVMSKAFMAVEGFQAVDIEYPIMSANDQYLGSLSMLIKPDSMLVDIIEPIIKGVPVNIWVMQKNGVILYDHNKEELGKNLFTDKTYKPYGNLQSLGLEIIKNKSGFGSYTFLSDTMREAVEKQCFWETIGLYDMEWKIVLTSQLSGAEAIKGSKESIKYIREKLMNFIHRDDLREAFLKNDDEKIKEYFGEFYAEYPYIYSIQWTDTSMVGRFGIPSENSLTDYNYRDTREDTKERNESFIKIVENQKPVVVEHDLLEGNRAIFIVEPVIYEDTYFGIMYIMILK